MHAVEGLRLGEGQVDALLGDDAQARGLELGVDRAGQVAPGGVRLDDRERALNGHRWASLVFPRSVSMRVRHAKGSNAGRPRVVALREAAQTGARGGRAAAARLAAATASERRPMAQHVLTLRCDNRPGIVAAVATRLAANGGDITEAPQFDDSLTGKFFMRVAFGMGRGDRGLREGLRRGGGAVRARLDAAARRAAAAGADPRFDVRPLPDRPALPLADRRTADAGGGHRLQPSAHEPGAERVRRHSLSPSAGDPGPRRRRKPRSGASSRRRARSWWCWRATCRSCRTRSRPGCRGGASISTTASCRASRARSPIIRRTSAG